MILPIRAFGDPVLRAETADIEKVDDEIKELIDNMFETMYEANGVGLAAPQIGKSVRMFVVDASPFADDEDEDNEHLRGFKKVFINPEIIEDEGEEWDFAEGCLSIPAIREDVSRRPLITLDYYDENMEHHTEKFDGYAARVIQHELDHLDGILFTDHLSALRRQMLKRKLNDISKGIVDVKYKMKFPPKKSKVR